ncbi:hypothetical protein LTR70_000132 [Exophiala xenobiotica]|uniref:Glycoside hydrolase family 31 protein n=1 Tax=Lithohypha guttulata TaxID=1690604 RepID=A0ABR0KR56_9EURO|nr:hypothetical protein LTR24_000257 [Lithohypha guttulata]KAK5330810.1 hypothetical protein LTR70_000132 [Exophiala xenobiotica]
MTPLGYLTIHDAAGRPILLEKNRTRIDPMAPGASALEVPARDFKPISASNLYKMSYRLESLDTNERIYGGGQYQQSNLDLKGCDLELAQRNSQASVPFFVSSLGYGMLWNNPAVGRVVFGKNGTTFEADATEALDLWIVCPPTPQTNDEKQSSNVTKEILRLYADVTGHAPQMPEYALGFWQCKLRYRTQEEVLAVAREFQRRKLPLSVIVVDFFHWPTQGDWRFDSNFFSEPKVMVSELESMGVKLLVSVWPTVDRRSENYPAMHERGYLIRTDRGLRIAMDFMGNTLHADFTNPKAREFVWNVCKRNYHDLGVKMFWLDEAEPEYSAYDFENYRYYEGTDLAVGNVYPAFWDGQVAAGQKSGEICNLVRCAWAGSQKFGTLVWSGDIASSWSSFRNQLAAGLNMGMSGIPWWTTDIGGFHGGETANPAFRELLVRWFQWGCFCPVMRLHGSREPIQPKLGEGGGSECRSGADNEPWSFGEENYPILVKYLRLRERLKPYIAEIMDEASRKGTPVMRPMFLEFPDDKGSWEVEDQYMFGGKYLVAPIMEQGMKTRNVYLPSGASWAALRVNEDKDEQGEKYEGGKTIEVVLTMEDMPIFVKTT